MGLIRNAIILGVVFVALPSPPEEGAASSETTVPYNNASYFVAATGAVSDLASFCQRQPSTCAVAGYITHKVEMKAKYSFKLIYEWASGRPDPVVLPGEAEPAQPKALPATKQKSAVIKLIETDSTSPQVAVLLASNKKAKPPSSNSTLEEPDILPPWQGPTQA